MALPIKGVEYTFSTSLVKSGSFIIDPTIVTGDFKIRNSSNVMTNLTNLPVVNPAGTQLVDIIITAAESSALDIAHIIASDQAGSQWEDTVLTIDFPTATAETLTSGGSNVTQIVGSADAALRLRNHALLVKPVTFSSGTTTTGVMLLIGGETPSSVNDVYNGRIFVFSAPSSLKDQVTKITDYVGSTKTVTFSTVTAAVSSSTVAVIE